jgi:lactoylglutathione lyase
MRIDHLALWTRDRDSAESGPRVTGDGYYEAVVRDPDGNAVEVTA